MNQIYFVIGTKAQFIKCKPVINYLAEEKNVNILLTNQHSNFLINSISEINPKVEITNYIENNTVLDSLTKNLGWFLKSVYKITTGKTLRLQTDSLIINHGDTLSALIGLVIAKKNKLKKLHLEAGLRSGKYLKPFPEEIIRKIVSSNSNYLVADGAESFKNIDKYFENKQNFTTTTNTAYENLQIKNSDLDETSEEIIILMHRSENIYSKNNLKNLISFLTRIKNKKENLKFVWIMHPSTLKQLKKYKLFNSLEPIMRVQELTSHENFISMLIKAKLFITDSLSAEFESSALNKKTVVWRNSFINRYGLESFLYLTKDMTIENKLEKTFSLLDKEIKTSLKTALRPSREFLEIIEKIEKDF